MVSDRNFGSLERDNMLPEGDFGSLSRKRLVALRSES